MIVPQVAGIDRRTLNERAVRKEIELARRDKRLEAHRNMAYYIKQVWPWFIIEEIHLVLCQWLMALEENFIDRLMVFMSPRAGKSRTASIILPSHYLGRYAHREVMQAGHSDDLSRGFGRETKNITASPVYQRIFPGFKIAPDSKAAGRWHTHKNGQYIATGLTGGIAGKGFHLGIVDDPLSEQDARSKKAQQFAVDWYGGGFYTRQAADVSAILMMGCLTAETPILRADGTETRIDQLRAGDKLLSWHDGRMIETQVDDWRELPEDDVFEVKTPGHTVRGNARHPFLVAKDDGFVWVRLSDLKPGDYIVCHGMRTEGERRAPESLAWLIGVMMGDGWTNVRPLHHTTYFAAGADKAHDELVLKTVRDHFGVAMKWCERERYYRADSRALTDFMRECGVTKCRDKRVPAWMFAAHIDTRRAFLRGIIDSDGNQFGKNAAQVELANEWLVRDLRIIARSCGFKTSNITQRTRTVQAPSSPAQTTNTTWRFSWGQWGGKGFVEEFGLRRVRSINPVGRFKVYDIAVSGPANYIADGLVVHNTRWDKNDLFGQLLARPHDAEFADDWAVLRVPALIDAELADVLNEVSFNPLLRTPEHPKRYKYKAGDSFAPRRWPMKSLLRRKANLSTMDWEALYMQNPTVAEGGILKRAWWRKWPDAKPPKCLYVIQVYDTAFSEEAQENNDFSARTTWGIFEREEQKNEDGITMPSACVILLERMQRRLGFPELRVEAEEAYKKYEPDRVLIEKKASGQSLIQELRRLRVKGKKIPVVPVKRDTDKISRAYAASAILEHGFVYYMDREWAQGVIDECADFPNGGHDDLVDTCLDAWLWLRRTFHLRMRAEEDEEEDGIDLTPRRLYG